MKKKVAGIFLGLFFGLAIIGIIVFLVGFVENPETMRLSPHQEQGSSMNPVSGTNLDFSTQQQSYLESLLEWFE